MRTRSILTIAGLAAIAGTIAVAQPPRDSTKPAQPPAKPAQPGDHAIPPGMSEEDMQACVAAMTPGAEHQQLAKAVGTWQGKTKMWMTPDAQPVESTCTTTISTILDGRFVKCETTGEMPGMGPFNGFGIQGFDNVSKKYQTTWIDNCGTGMATGTGEASPGGKTMTWKLTYNCPIQKKPTTMREIERRTGENTMTFEIFGVEPHSGKEFKMMEIAYTRDAKSSNGAR